MVQHMRLHLVLANTHARYIHLSVERHTQGSIKTSKLNRQKFCVLSDSSSQSWQHHMMLEIAWLRSVWITKD